MAAACSWAVPPPALLAKKRNNNGGSICLPGGYFPTSLASRMEYWLDALTASALQFQWMRLLKNEDGGDVSEYTLLITFLLLVSACLFLSSATNVSSVWQAANSFITRGAGQSHGVSSEVP
jgi:Flp pilus assembly pilin Flp